MKNKKIAILIKKLALEFDKIIKLTGQKEELRNTSNTKVNND